MRNNVMIASCLSRAALNFGWQPSKLILWILFQFFLSHAETFNLDSQTHAVLMPEEPSKFFGYNFAVKASENLEESPASFLVGSPKALPTNLSESEESLFTSGIDFFRYTTPGNIHNCDFDFSSSVTYCPTSNNLIIEMSNDVGDDADEQIALTDSIGISFATQANADNVTVCAPLRIQNCSSHYFLYGTCQTSDDFGRSWSQSRRGINKICPVDHLDLVFLLDGSGSVNAQDKGNFDRIKAWVQSVTRGFNLQHFARIGVIQYSHHFPDIPLEEQKHLETHVELGEYQNHQDFNTAVDRIEYHGFTTYTAAALEYATLELMNSSRFANPKTEKIILLLTDGRSNDNSRLANVSATIRGLGINIIAVGVAEYSLGELLTITGNRDKVFELSDFSQLNQIVDELQGSISNSLEGSSTAANSTNALQQAESGLDAVYTRTRRLGHETDSGCENYLFPELQ